MKIIIGNEYIQVIKRHGNQVSVLGKIKTNLRDIFIPFSEKYHHSIKIFFSFCKLYCTYLRTNIRIFKCSLCYKYEYMYAKVKT